MKFTLFAMKTVAPISKNRNQHRTKHRTNQIVFRNLRERIRSKSDDKYCIIK